MKNPLEVIRLYQTHDYSLNGAFKSRQQLLAVTGQWARAAAQLEVCGELDAGTLAMVNTYREALKCELVREAVFEGKTTPMVMGEPAEWVAQMIQALKAEADGDFKGARQLRAQALEQEGLIDIEKVQRQADGLIVIPHEQGDVNPGDWVDVMLFDTPG
mgnify:CR=1 FL=1